MEKKRLSKPMQNIILQLSTYSELKMVEFTEPMILNESIELWPKVDVLISFYSSGFPMNKGIDYVNLVKPI